MVKVSESLGPTIERELDILASQGRMPEMPGVLQEAQGEYTVVYESPLTRAQRAEEAAGMYRALEFATAHTNATGDLAAWDHIDIDEAMPEIMSISGVPEKWKRSNKAIETIRKQRDQQAQVQQAIEAAPAAVGALDKVAT